jgi:nicotinate-nucleotide adenylyltransferase
MDSEEMLLLSTTHYLEKNRLRRARIGVLGGTFNPIHFGHLRIARQVQRLFSLSQVHFVVAAIPPHKDLKNLIAFSHRYAMVSLATSGLASFIPSMVELEPQASPFSVDTLTKFSRRFPREQAVLYFIAGGDSLPEVRSWHESETLLSLCNFVFAMRPGTIATNPKAVLPEIAAGRVIDLSRLGPIHAGRQIGSQKSDDFKIYIVDVGAPDISATRIRELAGSERSIHRFVPGNVGEYIRKLHLYGGKWKDD